MSKIYLISVPLECFISQDFLSSFYRERWNTNAGNHDLFFFWSGSCYSYFL